MYAKVEALIDVDGCDMQPNTWFDSSLGALELIDSVSF